jgi:hypothetical protein
VLTWLINYNVFEEFHQLFCLLRNRLNRFFGYLRKCVETFDFLLSRLSHWLKTQKNYRQLSLSAENLLATVRYDLLLPSFIFVHYLCKRVSGISDRNFVWTSLWWSKCVLCSDWLQSGNICGWKEESVADEMARLTDKKPFAFVSWKVIQNFCL